VELAEQVPVVVTGPPAQVEKLVPIEEEAGPPPLPAAEGEQATVIEPAPPFKVEGLTPIIEEPLPPAEDRSSPQAIVEEVSRDDIDITTSRKAWWSRLLQFQPFSRPDVPTSQAVIEEMVEDEEEEDEVFPELEAEVWQSVIQAELLGQVVVGDEEGLEAEVFPQPLAAELEVEADAESAAQAEEAETPRGETEAVAAPEVEVAPPPAVIERPVEPEADVPAQVIEEETGVEAVGPVPEVESEVDVPVQVEKEEMAREALAPQPAVEPEADVPVQVEEEEMTREVVAPELGIEPEATREKPGIAQPSDAEIEPEPAVEVEPVSPADDWWWTPEAEAGPGQKVLKMKASPPPKTEAEVPSTPEAESPPAVEEWWTPEDQAEPTPPVPEQQVLKLKASLPPEAEAQPEPETEAGPPPSAEDWWSSEPEED
jgi:hypothetical protein